MSRYHRIDAPGYPRHLCIRGVDGMDCFRTDKDFHVFIRYLREVLARGGCSLNAFVLMTNHAHFLATPTEPGVLPRIMQSVGTRYARYFNAVHGRTGPLFGSRYWASLIETEPYFFTTMRYIELNPVRAQMVDGPGRYPWSSYLHNTGGERREELTFHDEFLNLGRTPADCARRWAAFVDQGIADDELARLRKQFNRNRPLGSDRFLGQFSRKNVPGT
jgi:putative transposase